MVLEITGDHSVRAKVDANCGIADGGAVSQRIDKPDAVLYAALNSPVG